MITSLALVAVLAAPWIDVEEVELVVTADAAWTEIRLADGTLVHRGALPVRDATALRVQGDLVARWTEAHGTGAQRTGAHGTEAHGTGARGTEADGRVDRESYCLRLGPNGPFSRARDARHVLHTRRGSFDPVLDGPPAIPDGLAQSGHLYIVQFVTQPIDSYRHELTERGAVVRHFMPDTAHLVEMDAVTAAEVEALPFVRWVGPYAPFYRLEQELIDGLAGGTYAPRRLHVQLAERGAEGKHEVAGRVADLGAALVRLVDDGFLFDAILDADQLRRVSAMDEVVWIDRWSPPTLDMDKVRIDGGADLLEAVAGITGAGVHGEVMDVNVDVTHPELQSNPVLPHGVLAGPTTHGTPVTGIVFGDGALVSERRGLLPDGQPIFASFLQLTDRYAHTARLLQAPYFAVFQTNSWGNARTPAYTSISMEMDDILFLNDIVVTQSQGNSGNSESRPQAWAKNIVSVGGIRHQDTQTLVDDCHCGGGSTGPAQDGRIKPDLAYWNDSILTIEAGGGGANFGGTSAATAMTAGYFGLLFQMWHDGIFGNAPGATVFESRPKATLARALMINGASRYRFVGPGADLARVHQGWGRASVETLHADRNAILWVNETDVLSETESITYPVVVTAGAPELAVTLVYLDVAGNPAASVNRVNDLSLRVSSPGGQLTYWGNHGLLAGNESTPGGTSNTVDVVENVFVRDPPPGLWTVTVIADEINADTHVETPQNDADFALVVRGVTICPAPAVYCQGAPNSVSANGADALTFGSTSLGANDFGLRIAPLPPLSNGLVVRSQTQASVPLGDGTLCTGSPIFRITAVQADTAGQVTYVEDVTTFPPGAMILSGSTWNYQLVYRDLGIPGGTGINASDGVAVTWCE